MGGAEKGSLGDSGGGSLKAVVRLARVGACWANLISSVVFKMVNGWRCQWS